MNHRRLCKMHHQQGGLVSCVCMFALAVLKDSVRIHPKAIQDTLIDPVIEVLNDRFCNRVVANVGLAVSVFDILELDDPYVHPGESHIFVKGT